MPHWSFLLMIALPVVLLGAEPDAITSALSPENVIHPGHSMRGESFDEGPRRAATLLGTTGRVTFPISTRIPLVQQFFNQGIGQLHGYWYFEAERSFRQAAKLDPDCAMTYFGMALANINNERRAKGFLSEAIQRKSNASEKEVLYIDALNAWYQAKAEDHAQRKSRARSYVKAIEEILYRYPDDLETKAFLCRTLVQLDEDLGLPGAFPVDALANDVLTVNPFHPVHHYRIHLWDNERAKVAVSSAERCGLSAPGIAHMWHMSGHTYSELNQYFDAVWHQEAAARTDHAYMMREGIFPDRIHNFAHNNEWLARNLQYVGRVHDAIAVAKNAIELPRHPKWNPLPGNKSADFGRLRLFQIYSQFEMWDELIADCQTQILAPTSDEKEQIKYHRLLGRAYFRKAETHEGQLQLAELERLQKQIKLDAFQAHEKTIDKSRMNETEIKESDSKRDKALEERTKPFENAIAELQGYVLVHEGKFTESLELFKKAGDTDESFLAQIETRAGQTEAALKRLREWAGKSKNQVRPLASLLEMLWQQGLKDEARQTFDSLREISGSTDLDMHPFDRLKPIASALGYADDWRKSRPVPRNSAELPDLASLGPLTWQPSPAPEITLPDSSGQLHSLADYRGRPVVIIFYLGYGCLHCAEQLKQFATRQQAFAESEINVIAISTDSVQNLKKSQDRYKAEGEIPFLLLSDASLSVFKTYHSYDDFEESPLHATFLVDGDGRIRWHDSGAEPFMEIDFLLNESRRLLNPAKRELSVKGESLGASESYEAPKPDRSLEATQAKSLLTAPDCN